MVFLAVRAGNLPAQVSMSALSSEAMDTPIPYLSVEGGLLDVMKSLEAQSGVRIEASPAVWDCLPWGQDTHLMIRARNATLRHALNSITRHLGLTYRLGDQAVVLEPSGALARLGRRATLEEVRVLDWLATTPLGLATTEPTVRQVLNTVDGRLLSVNSLFAVQDRGFDESTGAATIQVTRNATLFEALDDIDQQTDCTWYPWGHRLVVVKKVEAIDLRLGRRISREYHDADLAQVLMELSQDAGVDFAYEPGVLQEVPEKYQKVTLTLDDATVQQTLDILSGATGLKFTATEKGIDVTFGTGSH